MKLDISLPLTPRAIATRLAGLYILLSALWVSLSDWILHGLYFFRSAAHPVDTRACQGLDLRLAMIDDVLFKRKASRKPQAALRS
ncbi:MAG TPA: hypothetical protein VFA60_12830 [Terriglobales bacterium]|nr:hypothetical protein [Terriglobales bacterium]